jgi:predicted component of type VI protein secretion system
MTPRKTKKKDPSAKTPATQYEPTPQEIAAIKGYAERDMAKPSTRIKVSNEGAVPQLSVDHPDPTLGGILLSEALGTADSDFVAGLLDQISNAATKGRAPEEDKINFMFAVIKSIEPRDELEAMLAAQMAATHMAFMTFARRLNHVETIQQQDSAERAFTKLSRTFVAQLEALKRYRTGGQQRMTVEHVTVNEGGQAIVGNVTKGGGGDGREN